MFFEENEKIFIEYFSMNGKVSPHNFVHINGEQVREHSYLDFEVWQNMKVFSTEELGSKALIRSRSKVFIEIQNSEAIFYNIIIILGGAIEISDLI